MEEEISVEDIDLLLVEDTSGETVHQEEDVLVRLRDEGDPVLSHGLRPNHRGVEVRENRVRSQENIAKVRSEDLEEDEAQPARAHEVLLHDLKQKISHCIEFREKTSF